jgi:hypothetical protein
MTVSELIALLQSQDGNDLVVLAKDREGDGFSPLATISAGMYTAANTWSGEVNLRELTPALEKERLTQEDVGDPEEGAVPCITFLPVN